MSAAARAARTLGDVLVAPGAAWRSLAAAPPVVWLCAWVSALQVALVAVQTQLAWAALAAETGELVTEARQTLAATRALAIAATPAATCARALVLAALLRFASPAPLRLRMALALALEAVPLVEACATAALVAAAHPTDFDALRDLRLYCGLDLVWRPAAVWADAAVGAANAFSVWWALLAACGARHVLGARWRRAAGIAAFGWLVRVAWRAAWTWSP